MNKELEALEDIILYLNTNEPKGLYCENIEIIKAALKRLELIDKISPCAINYDFVSLEKKLNAFIHKEELRDKKVRALEIIKEKQVDVFIFLHSGDLETYNDMVEENKKLIQEDYDLLEEALL